jgi:hypothetical protein
MEYRTMKRAPCLFRSIIIALASLLATTGLCASPFSSDTKATREYFRQFCDYVATNKANVPVIFTGGYYMRDLVAGYKIFGEKRYLDTASRLLADGLPPPVSGRHRQRARTIHRAL